MICPTVGGVVIHVRVVTRASRPGVADVRNGELVVRLQSAPIDNAANEELVRRIADTFGVPKRAVSISSGGRSRRKQVRVNGINTETATRTLNSQLRTVKNSSKFKVES